MNSTAFVLTNGKVFFEVSKKFSSRSLKLVEAGFCFRFLKIRCQHILSPQLIEVVKIFMWLNNSTIYICLFFYFFIFFTLPNRLNN